MKIIHKYSPGLSVQVFRKCGDNPIGSFISGLFGLAETESVNDTNEDIATWQLMLQQRENQKNRDYNTQEAEKARLFESQQADLARQFTRAEREAQQQYQQDQWAFQQRNQLPLQMEGAKDAGLNPNVAASRVMSANGGSVAAPSGASSPVASGAPASYSGGLSPVPYQAQNPVQAFNLAAQGLSALATAKEKGANVSLIEKQVENMAVDTQYKKVLKDGVVLANKLQKINLKYADKKNLQDLAEQVARTATIKNEGELHAATVKIQNSIRKLNESLAKKHDQESQLLMLEIGSYDRRLTQQLKLQGAQIREANAKAFEAGQAAELNKVNAETINAVKPYVAQIKRAEAYIAQSTAPNKIRQAESDASKSSWFVQLQKDEHVLRTLEATDKRAYTAIQRILHGKSMTGDVSTVVQALSALGDAEYIK